MLSPLNLEAFVRQRQATLQDEARHHRLLYEATPSLRRRLALTLKRLADMLEPELTPRPVRPMGRNTPLI